jgi:hypothetical protein
MIKPAGKQSIDVGRVDPPPEYTMMTDMDVMASSTVGGEPNNSDGVRHVGLGRGIVKKMGPLLYKEVFTSTKVSMAGFTVSGIQSETSYLERSWPLFAGKANNVWFSSFYTTPSNVVLLFFGNYCCLICLYMFNLDT